jgi:GR25 family glycosyltransferase involved in LPS biosynthesis
MDINNTLQNIDFIGLINLITRDDRLSDVFNEFNKHNINTNHITLLRPNKHHLGGMFGCYDSHLKLYKKAIENNARYALIFEDDFEFIDKSTKKIIEKLNICINFINKNKENWDILKITNDHFIYINNYVDENIYDTCQASTQGYFINRHCMEKMLSYGVLMYDNEAFHIDMAQVLIYKFKIYTCIPEIIQNNENALNNDNSIDFPKIFKQDKILKYIDILSCFNKNSAHYISDHTLCKLLADLNLYNVSDRFIYINIFITLLISIITYYYLNKIKKNQNTQTYIIMCIIIIYVMIIIENLSIKTAVNYIEKIPLKYEIKKTYINNYKYNTYNNVSEFVLK